MPTTTQPTPTFDKAIRACRGLDDPRSLYEKPLCLLPISKNVRGELDLCFSERQECREPGCLTYKTDHVLRLEVQGFDCDGEASACLDGRFLVRNLVHALIEDGQGRGPHTGDFVWRGDCLAVVGEMSGMTNVGTHRAPVFDPCQVCNQRGVLEGRLVGRVVRAKDKRLIGCCVTAVYRIRFDPSEGFSDTGVEGTIEGVIVCPCDEGQCIGFDNLAVGTYPNPLDIGGARFDVRDHTGNPVADNDVVSWGAFTGLNAGFNTKITLTQPADAVAITLANFSTPPTVTAFDSAAAVVDSAVMSVNNGSERLELTGPDIKTVVVDSPQNETLILEFCVE
ncbi:MAG: hypothetical protein OEZ14_11815 [Acidimicrobiia bacterium]|nr:hypothetical protein [Acidimicrobiia bacterium]